MTALLLAALSAVLYGTGAAVEHRQAARTPAGKAGGVRLLILLVRQPLWLAGAALGGGAFAVHTAALRTGSLAAVQLILGCSLLVSVGVNARLARRVLPRRCWPAIFIVVAAIGVSVTLLGPSEHSASNASGRAALAALVTGMVTVPIAAAGLLSSGRRARPLLLAVAAGMADTCMAVLTMAFAHSSAHGPSAVVTSWPFYGLLVAGLASLTLTQAAYQTDAPLITLPVITSVTPLASLTVGIVALHETADLSAARSVTIIACLACGLAALVVLARVAAESNSSLHAPVQGPQPACGTITSCRSINSLRPSGVRSPLGPGSSPLRMRTRCGLRRITPTSSPSGLVRAWWT
jgi:drug/metabolite transporter (DMT)-like permease